MHSNPSLLLRVLLALALAVAMPTVYACSCLTGSEDLSTNVRNAYAHSTIVVYAEAIKVRHSRRLRWNPIGFEPIETVEWRVVQAWKGNRGAGDLLTSSTMTECCACGESVKVGEKQLFYLVSDQNLSVSTCSLGRLFPAKEQIQVLEGLSRG